MPWVRFPHGVHLFISLRQFSSAELPPSTLDPLRWSRKEKTATAKEVAIIVNPL